MDRSYSAETTHTTALLTIPTTREFYGRILRVCFRNKILPCANRDMLTSSFSVLSPLSFLWFIALRF